MYTKSVILFAAKTYTNVIEKQDVKNQRLNTNFAILVYNKLYFACFE